MALLIGTNLAVITLFTAVMAIFGVDTQSIAGLTVFAALFGFGGAFISLALSKTIAKRSTGAKVIEQPTNDTERWLLATVERLSRDAGIDTPEVAIFPSDAPNAFATGAKRNDSLVAVSTGLFRSMNADEIEAVLAHEVAHVANGDMVTLTLIQGVVNTFVILLSRILASFLANFLTRGRSSGGGIYFLCVIVLQIVLGFFASMIVMWFSRRREFRADSGSAALTSNTKMISALQALQRSTTEAHLPDEVEAMGIQESGGGTLRKLVASHPPLEDRIAALR
ncbi:MAG: protease HtpX [Actinomycetota bacterium]